MWIFRVICDSLSTSYYKKDAKHGVGKAMLTDCYSKKLSTTTSYINNITIKIIISFRFSFIKDTNKCIFFTTINKLQVIILNL